MPKISKTYLVKEEESVEKEKKKQKKPSKEAVYKLERKKGANIFNKLNNIEGWQ